MSVRASLAAVAVVFGTLFVVGCSQSTSPTIPASVAPSASSQVGSGTLTALTATGRQAFGFNAPLISGFPGGRSIELTGGGAYDPETGFVHSSGGFRCLSNIAAGPFNTCQEGQGVRWDTSELLSSTTFKCTGAAGEALKTAHTGNLTVVLLSDFYRQGDGVDESFTAQMIVSDSDLDPVAAGVQNIWVQGVGCGTAITNFNP